MKFNVIAWAALCYFYRSVADAKYVRVMTDAPFLTTLRDTPSFVSIKEFEEKIILNYIKMKNYDLLPKNRLADEILAMIVELQPELLVLRNTSIMNCDLSDEATTTRINNVYRSLCSVPGLWSTGASKILHILNDKLFTVLDPCIAAHFGLLSRNGELVPFLRLVQADVMEIVEDYHQHGFVGLPEDFLAQRLGYAQQGCHKSLIKFIDEYYWLHLVDGLPVPPWWTPNMEPEALPMGQFSNPKRPDSHGHY
jgi:hypothetical protein